MNLDWVIMVTTVVFMQLLTWKKWYAWPVGILNQVFWFFLTWHKELYGLTALSVIMACQFSYGWYMWTRKRGVSPS